MIRFSLFLSAVLGCAAVLMSSPPAEARPAEPRHIFERIFGPPVGARTRRAYSVRRVRPASPRRAVAARPPGPSRQAGPVRRVRPDARPQHHDLAARQKAERTTRAEARPARIMPDAELVEFIMTDPTLRRGDVVEFPDGPRVYRGNGRFSSHKFSDFDDVPAEQPVATAARPAAAGSGADPSAGVAGMDRRQESAEAGRN